MIDTITISSVTLNSGAYAVTGVPGLEFPSVRAFSYDLPGQNFGVHSSAYYGRRSFSIQGMIIGSDGDDYLSKRDDLITALDILNGEQSIVFALTNGISKRITAILRSLDAPPDAGMSTASRFAASFEAAFPYLESTSPHITTVTPALPGGGMVPPDTMPMGLSQGSGGSISAENAGNAPSYPTARITGPVTNPTIRNDRDSSELRLAITLDAGEYLDVDFKRKTITDATGRNRYDVKSGDWFTLLPGTTEVRLIADSTDTSAALRLTWYDTYLNL